MRLSQQKQDMKLARMGLDSYLMLVCGNYICIEVRLYRDTSRSSRRVTQYCIHSSS